MMKKILKVVVQYSLLFIVLLFLSCGIVRLFSTCGLIYRKPSTVAFCGALFATLILMLAGKIKNRNPQRK